MQEKLYFNSIMVEITRKCNLKCSHCMRGKPQNITLKKSYIDKFINDIIGCKWIFFTGGEPLLYPDIIRYFVDKIINSDTEYLEITVNGTILNNEVVKIFGDFCLRGDNRTAIIRISNDYFHDKETAINAFKFFRGEIDRLGYPADRLKVLYTVDWDTLPELRYAGNVLKQEPAFFEDSRIKKLNIEPKENHRIKIVDGKVFCQIYLCANGNLSLSEEQSFETIDKLSLGNIMYDSVTNIIIRNNENCLLTCRESFCWDKIHRYFLVNDTPFLRSNIDRWDHFYAMKNLYFEDYICNHVGRFIFKRIHSLRMQAHEAFPNVSVQEIIELFPTPYDYEYFVRCNVNSILTFSDPVTDDMLASVDEDTKHKYKDAVNYLRSGAVFNDLDSYDGKETPNILQKNIRLNYFVPNEIKKCENYLRLLALINQPTANIDNSYIYGHFQELKIHRFISGSNGLRSTGNMIIQRPFIAQ